MTGSWLSEVPGRWSRRSWRRHARAASAREERSLTEQWQWGYAVRADWPDGTHMLTAWEPDVDRALRKLRRQRAYWRGAPLVSPAWNIVAANRDLVRHHEDQCRSPKCPQETAADPPGWKPRSGPMGWLHKVLP